MQNTIYQVKLNSFQKLAKIDRAGIYMLAQELSGLFELKKRNFDKYLTKLGGFDKDLEQYQAGTKLRAYLETAMLLVLDKQQLGEKERTRLRLVIDGIATKDKPANVSGLQWNKGAMTTAHTSHRGASSAKTTANYKKK